MPTEEERKAAMELDAQDDNSSAGEDDTEEEEEQVETLVAGRSKRATAGNRMSSMVAEIAADDDLELLFADDEEAGPDEEFDEDAEDGNSDNDLGESSDDEDQGPAAGGDDLDGEKEIEKQRKNELKRKRKAQQAFTKPSKRIKVVPMPGASKIAPSPRPSKKVERTSWIPGVEATRYSRREATAQQAETLRTRIEAREEERKAQAHKLEAAAKKREAARAKVMTQEEHLAEAAQVAKENSKSLNRWEAMERERQEEQKARLAALQNRQLTGPVIQYWSGQARWLGDKLSAVGVPKIKEVEQKEIARAEREKEREEKQKQKEEKERQKEAERQAAGITDVPTEDAEIAGSGEPQALNGEEPATDVPILQTSPGKLAVRPKSSDSGPASIPPPSLLSDYAPSPTPQIPNQQDMSSTQSHQATSTIDSASRADSATPAPISQIKREASNQPLATPLPAQIPPTQQTVFPIQPASSVTHTPITPSATTSTIPPSQLGVLNIKDPNQPSLPAGPPAPPPLPEIAARVLISVLNVELGGRNDAPVISSLPAELKDSVLVSKGNKAKRTQGKAASASQCPVTGLAVKYRDPVTETGYHNSYAFRQLQKVTDSKLRWSQMASCYLGAGSQVHAQGVPEGFGQIQTKKESVEE